MKKPREELRETHAITVEEVDALLAACDPRYPTGLMYRSLLSLLAASGMRIREALGITPSHLQESKEGIRIRIPPSLGKGAKGRVAPTDEFAIEHLERWLERREEILGKPARRTPIFCTISKGKAGRPLTRQQVWSKLQALAKKAGLTTRIHPHAFRHAFTLASIAEGQTIDTVQKALGHASLGTTTTYVKGLTTEQAVRRMSGRKRRGVLED